MTERLVNFKQEIHGDNSLGLRLVPPSTEDADLFSGLNILFEEGVINHTILPGSPHIDGNTVSVEEWVEYISSSDSREIIHSIQIKDGFGEDYPFHTVGDTTVTPLDIDSGYYETRVYIYNPEDRGKGIGGCALKILVDSLKKTEIKQLLAFVSPVNIGSLLIHWSQFGEPTKGYPGKDYSTRVFVLDLSEEGSDKVY